jgi:probable HAF family extracellular repeat protein
MISKQHLIKTGGAIALAACLIQGTPSANAQTYSVTDLGVLDGKTQATAVAINEAGQVAGTANGGPGTEAAFRYNGPKGGLEDLGQDDGRSVSRAYAIAQDGRVVGESTKYLSSGAEEESVSHAVIFEKDSLADLGTLPKAGPFSRATGTNSAGQVVGFAGSAFGSAESRAFLWTASSGMVDLGALGGVYAQAMAINEDGVVTGNAEILGEIAGARHAFLFEIVSTKLGLTGGMRDLGTLGGTHSYGTAINGQNHVAGYSSMEGDDRVHAFLFDGKQMHDLGSLSPDGSKSDQSYAFGINNNGQVVGYSFVSQMETAAAIRFGTPLQSAFISQDGVMVDLNTLIGKEAVNYHLYSASGINDNGEIVATAYDLNTETFRAVVLKPVLASQSE